MSYKNFNKKLSKVTNTFSDTLQNKQFFYSFYYSYFKDIAINFFEWLNLPDSIPPLYIEKSLFDNGHLAIFEDKYIGLVAQKGVFMNRLDMYDNQLLYKPINLCNKNFGIKHINWWNDLETEQATKKAYIIQNTYDNEIPHNWLDGFCVKLAEIEQTIQLNRNAQIMPYLIVADDSTLLSLNNIYNKILNGDNIIRIKTQVDKNGFDKDKQLDDYIKVFNTNAPYLLDKLHDEKQRIINQILTKLGINNNAVDKAERLVKAEATSNNGLINASIETRYKPRRLAVERINKVFNLNIQVMPNERILQYNTEQVVSDIDSSLYMIGDE